MAATSFLFACQLLPIPTGKCTWLRPHGLTELQQQDIFAAYRIGVGPRALAEHYGVTERAIKYLVKKHGIQRGPRARAIKGQG